MSARSTTTAVLTTVALAVAPASALARAADQVDTSRPAAAPAALQQPSVGRADEGTDAATLIALAAGTLLVGGAGGFAASRMVVRRPVSRA